VRLRVLVYNVKAFRRGVRGAAALVAEYEPDIALIQECGPRYRLRRFASTLGMDVTSHHDFLRRSIHNAVLVRPPWRIVSKRLHRFPKDRPFYPRGILVARVGRAGFRVWVGSVHLGLEGAARRRNVEELVALAIGLDGPVLVGGDFNEGPESAAVRWLSQRMWDCFGAAGEGPGETFPSDGATARIDYIFANEAATAERVWVLGGAGAAATSDHLPLFGDVVLSNGGNRLSGGDPVR
jgi:endonuclease/exonuclease/phosphatase family metal-dependent hydrolase